MDTLQQYLNRDKIMEAAETWLSKNAAWYSTYNLNTSDTTRINFSSDTNNDSAYTIVDIKYLTDGTTSIIYKVGKLPIIGKDLAEYIVENTSFPGSGNQSYSTTDKDLDEFISYLENKEDVIVSYRGADCFEVFYKDWNHCRITHYPRSNKILIQGKPLNAFYICKEYLES